MTTLEILRLDTTVNSPKRTKTKSSPSHSDINDLPHEIPINILKSPSYTSTNSPILLSIETVSPELQKKLEKSFSSKNSTKTSSQNSFSTTNNSNKNLSNINNKSLSNTSSSASDDIDYALNNALGNNSNSSNPELNMNTLRFNKYGFVQFHPPSAGAESTNSIGIASKRPSNKSNQSSKTNSPNKTNDKLNINGNESEDKEEPIKNKSVVSLNSQSPNNGSQTIESSSPVAVTNLKDYLQNTDVEVFAEHLPIDVVRTRETKWIEMLKNFDEWMSKRFKKIKSRCRKGIPQSMRSRAWMHLTGAFILKQQKPNYYNECLQNVNNIDVNKYIEDIKKDLHRQFPSHEIFMKKEGRRMLFNVLRAYAVHNKEVGYCQAQGPIAALLLMHMPEEDSFWMLIRISDFYLKEYFKPGLERVQIDGQALFYLFKKENQLAHKLMKNQGVEPVLYMTEWFMCVFARTLPWCTVLRVWDMFFCEGIKVLYRVGLYLMKSAFNDKLKFQRCQQQGLYETLNLLKNLPVEALTEINLVRESSAIKFSEEDLKKAYDRSAEEFIKQTNELNKNRKQPPPVSSYKNLNKKS